MIVLNEDIADHFIWIATLKFDNLKPLMRANSIMVYVIWYEVMQLDLVSCVWKMEVQTT